MTLKSVLTVATFSEASENALERAATLAAQHAAPLHVLHCPWDDGTHIPDYHHRLALRASQLERRHGIEIRTPHLSERKLFRWLEKAAQELLVVVDPRTAQQLRNGEGLLRSLGAGASPGGRLIGLRACALWIVKRPGRLRHQRALLPYREESEAEHLLAWAGLIAAGAARELFCVQPLGAPLAGAQHKIASLPWNEWPPPVPQAPGADRLVHSHYLGTRLNRAVRSFGTASTTQRIRNQVRFSAADLVIAPYIAPTLAELLLRRSLRERLIDALDCDLAFLPDPDCRRTALSACERLAPARPFGQLACTRAQEGQHA